MATIKGTVKLTEFTVKGWGEFPIDMLRYDRCWPKSESGDVLRIASSFNSRISRQAREVTLVSINTLPTVARWESFGWKVVSINGK